MFGESSGLGATPKRGRGAVAGTTMRDAVLILPRKDDISDFQEYILILPWRDEGLKIGPPHPEQPRRRFSFAGAGLAWRGKLKGSVDHHIAACGIPQTLRVQYIPTEEVSMPVYEYYCENCGTEYDLIRPVSRINEPAQCARCGQEGRRQLSHFSFKSNTFSAPKLGPPSQAPFRSHNQEPPAAPGENAPAG